MVIVPKTYEDWMEMAIEDLRKVQEQLEEFSGSFVYFVDHFRRSVDLLLKELKGGEK